LALKYVVEPGRITLPITLVITLTVTPTIAALQPLAVRSGAGDI
jgi:hypothetical protein